MRYYLTKQRKKYPKLKNTQRQKLDYWLPWARGKGEY